MKKNTILKKINYYEDSICNAIQDFRDFLDSTEDPDLSSMGGEFCEMVIDFIHENDTMNTNDIKEFATNELE